MEVTLADFFLGLPVRHSMSPPAQVMQWTVFHRSAGASEQFCAATCEHMLDCLTHFLGHDGCFFAFHNHTRRESELSENLSTVGLEPAANRSLGGRLLGCKLRDSRPDVGEAGLCAMTKSVDQRLYFGVVNPDWRGNTARLSLAVTLDVGGQHFQSESSVMDLKRGFPLVSDSFACLLGEPTDQFAGTQVMQIAASIQEQGDILLTVYEFDPQAIKSLRLILLPMLPDRASCPARIGASAAGPE